MARKESTDSTSARGFGDIIGVVLIAGAFLLMVSLFSFDRHDLATNVVPPNKNTHNWIGPIGAWTANLLFKGFGATVYLLPMVLLAFGLGYLFQGLAYLRTRWVWAALLFVCCMGLLDLYTDKALLDELATNPKLPVNAFLERIALNMNASSAGGITGLHLNQIIFKHFGTVGATIIFLALYFISLLFLTNFRLGDWLRGLWVRKPVTPEGVTEEEKRPAGAPARNEKTQKLTKSKKEGRAADLPPPPLPQPPVPNFQNLHNTRPPPTPIKKPPKKKKPPPTRQKQFPPPAAPAAHRRGSRGKKIRRIGKKKKRKKKRRKINKKKRKRKNGGEKKKNPGQNKTPLPVFPPSATKKTPEAGAEKTKTNHRRLHTHRQLPVAPDGFSPAPGHDRQADRVEGGIDGQRAAHAADARAVRHRSFARRHHQRPDHHALRIASRARREAGKNHRALQQHRRRAQGRTHPHPRARARQKLRRRRSAEPRSRPRSSCATCSNPDEWRNTKARIPLALGKDVYGHPIIADLAEMPHLLIAGSTGSGKSVCINAIIASLLYRFSPDQLALRDD